MESSWGKKVVFVKMERGWNLEPAESKESVAFTVHSISLACQLPSLMHLHQTRQLGCQSTVQWKIPLASHKLDMELFSYSERRPGLPIFFRTYRSRCRQKLKMLDDNKHFLLMGINKLAGRHEWPVVSIAPLMLSCIYLAISLNFTVWKTIGQASFVLPVID